jgi:hypothetical protein
VPQWLSAIRHLQIGTKPTDEEHIMKSNLGNMPLLTAVVAAVALSAGALAAPPPDDAKMPTDTTASAQSTYPANKMDDTTGANQTAQAKFDELDVDHDGSIDKKEAVASKTLNLEFKQLDADKDGKLSLAEFMSASDMAKIQIDRKAKRQ